MHRRLARATESGSLQVDIGVAPDVARRSLLSLKGIGPWTADYIVMRGLSHPDIFLGSDLGVRHGLSQLGISEPSGAPWAPWRSYAVHHVWASLGASNRIQRNREDIENGAS